MKHSTLSASAAHRWVNCSGSVVLSADLPDTPSPAAAEGTMLHAVMDWCLTNGKDAIDSTEPLTDEQVESVQFCLDHVRSIKGSGRFYEMQVAYGHVLGVSDAEAFGTLDVAILDDKHLHVLDAKFGRRYVAAEGNFQMILYAIGVVSALEVLGDDVDELSLHIMQPRIGASEVRPWIISRKDLDGFAQVIGDAAKRVMEASDAYTGSQDAAWVQSYLNPSEDACQWCRAKASCKALAAVTTQVIDEFDVVKAEDLSDAQLAENMGKLPLLELFIEATRAEASRRIMAGGKVPGFKMVLGRQGNRRWDDSTPEALVEFLKRLGVKNPYGEPTLLTPSGAERVIIPLVVEREGVTKKAAKDIAQAMLSEHVTRSDAKPTLAPADHPGAEWTQSAGLAEFD